MEAHIKGINDRIQSILDDWSEGEFDLQAYGIAEGVAVYDQDSDKTFPVMVLPSGECYDVYGETDKHAVTLYHRLNEITFQEVDSIGSHKQYQEVDSLSLLVFGKRAIISQYQMEKIARKAIAFDNSQTIERSDFNSLQVFANEYVGVRFFLTPDYFLFKINYRITSAYDDRCANI